MNPPSSVRTAVGTSLLEDFSLEMTGKDVPELEEARDTIPQGTRINITFLGNEDLRMRLDAAREVKRLGFVPVPHISARRLGSRDDFERFLAGLHADGTSDNVFVVGGDPARPEGPYADSLSLIGTGLLQEYGVRHVGISGYPEGHPAIDADALWSALRDKHAALADQPLEGCIITQFGFAVDPVLAWVEEVRRRGIDLPIRIGVPGPAGVRRLLSYAARFGVGTSASVVRKYGFSLTNLMGTAGPDRFLRDLTAAHDPGHHGELKIHFYTFGGLGATSDWAARIRKESPA
ncbi:methylenetetrahydrofolate reductase [Streptomyces violaceusniger]|uniref:Methylenetetrahydrofolate reductase n=1 Tax=Streptomyces violaceusniger (strain Tu 4113) TaxID=653045 RepID=G2PGL8_STRV4|nr:methylenetetrahydrofolate reductase [Streptomyces violaceusniger]AEM85597.1 methylenetetrahydrofolate reductase [Streptomyces violaceusniger Tu 4113]